MIAQGRTSTKLNSTQYNFVVIVVLLVLGSSVSIMSTDMYTPSLPHLSDYFVTTADMVKLTISLNVIMLGMGQLILGPISDRYGRRPILLCSLCLFTVFTFAGTFTHTIEQLIVTRMFQGFMAAGHAVISLAIYKDLFDEKQQVKAIAISGMAVALAPAVAPIIGGYVHIALGWKYNFYIVGLVALLLVFLTWRLLPESTVPDKNALQVKNLKINAWKLITNKIFLVYAAMTGIGMGVIYIFVTGTPFVFIQVLNVPTEHFGYFQAVTVLTYFMGSVIAAKFIERGTSWQVFNIGTIFLLIGGIYLLLTIFFDSVSKLNMLFSFALMAFGIGPLFAIAYPKAMQATHNIVPAGAAASMLGAIQMTIAGTMTMLLSLFHDGSGSIRPLGYTMMILMVTFAVLWSIAKIESRRIPSV